MHEVTDEDDCMSTDTLLDKNVEREILNHRQLVHPNILAFKEVFTTDTELAIVVSAHNADEHCWPSKST